MAGKIYLHRNKPELYPDFTTRHARAVLSEDLGDTVRFTTIRRFHIKDRNLPVIGNAADFGAEPIETDGSEIDRLEDELNLYVEHFHLGDMLWLETSTLFTKNLDELLDVCRERGYYIFDIFGCVPGSRPVSSSCGDFPINDAIARKMHEKLGTHFVGFDNGEQDGRYIAKSTSYFMPQKHDRFSQYQCFQHYFERLNDDMQNFTVTLASLTMLPYFAREGNTILLGAETAQGLPSVPMWYAFIRGAGKQYGLNWFGNVSIYSRWGFKDYGTWEDKPGKTASGMYYGIFEGCSLSLMRRLTYNEYMYGCEILGMEDDYFSARKAKPGEQTTEDTLILGNTAWYLSPIGDIQQNCRRFVETYGRPGTLYTPVAFVADAFSGWIPPRHQYSREIYRVWGTIPYGIGDYQLHCLLDFVYPGYDDSAYFRDERGFVMPTPYGEIADVLLSDVRAEILCRYDTVVLCSDVNTDHEFCGKLKTFVERGGHLIVFGKSPIDDDCVTVISGTGLVQTGDEEYRNGENESVPHPYVFSEEAKATLDRAFSSLQLVRVNNPALQYTLAIKDETHYTLYVANNTYADEHFNITAPAGTKIVSVEEEIITDHTKERPEFLTRPQYYTVTEPVMTEGEYELSMGDCRIFSVTVDKLPGEVLPESYPKMRNEHLYIRFDDAYPTAKTFLLKHPTFLHHFKGLTVPADYFDRLSMEEVRREAHYFRQQKVSVILDFTRMINQYPDLTLIGNFPNRTEESMRRMREIITKAAEYGLDGVILAIQHNAETDWSQADADLNLQKNLRALGDFCETLGVPAYCVNRPMKKIFRYENEMEFIDEQDVPPLAFHTGYSLYSEGDTVIPENARLLMLADTYFDRFGSALPHELPISSSPRADLFRKAYEDARAKGYPVILSAQYESWDDVIRDAEFLGE